MSSNARSEMQNKILVIEDIDKDLTSRITTSLVKLGYAVQNAESVKQAYVKMDEFQPELVIMVKSNPDDIKGISERLRLTFDSFILLIGTGEDATVWEKSVDAGADFYMIYPFSFIEFEARVKSLLRRQDVFTSHRDSQNGHQLKGT